MTIPLARGIDTCALCEKAEDDGEDSKIWWIGCSAMECSREYHISCVGLTADTMPRRYQRWYCPMCSEKKSKKRSVKRSVNISSPSIEQPNHLQENLTVSKVRKNDSVNRPDTIPEPRASGVSLKSAASILFLALVYFLTAYFFYRRISNEF
ncbi:hypothetical protein LOD99_16101 [Oopsacas minuta]|uniref:PHD-type domain-containing protein n=1 Tax=Oopsacas minuta TaxID=111878 RepID=A0AAV7K7Q6_9METZ|nr:hypothetical protein LOD99_16101 [Oopsacas minuta]